eukprot:3203335-Prymnesium_polylepis.1
MPSHAGAMPDESSSTSTVPSSQPQARRGVAVPCGQNATHRTARPPGRNVRVERAASTPRSCETPSNCQQMTPDVPSAMASRVTRGPATRSCPGGAAC